MKKKSQKGKIILLIVLLVITVVLGVVAFVILPSGEEKPGEVQKPKDICTVTFLGPDDAVLYVDEVAKGEAAQAPAMPLLPQGYIFSHWDSDFSCVTENMTVRAVCQQLSETGNTISLAGGQVKKGEAVTLPLQLGGQVCLCALNVKISYDNTALDFAEFGFMDGLVDANCIEEEGVIYLNYASPENTSGDVDLADLKFTAIGGAGQTSVEIEVIEVIAFDDAYEFYVPECTTIPATILIAE